MSDMNIPEPALRATILSPSPLPGFFVSSTSNESIILDTQSAGTVPFSVGTHDTSRNTTMVTCSKSEKKNKRRV